MTKVSIVIPTLRRPDGLTLAVRSVFAQDGIDFSQSEIVIVDNDPDASARDVVTGLQDGAPLPVVYVHEPNPGVANARNAAMAALNARLVAFLDDDQSAPTTWLARLLAAHRVYNAPVTFGPVDAVLPDSVRNHKPYLQRFFSRVGPEHSDLIEDYYGCGNSLFDLDQLPHEGELFDTFANEIGGEDDFLFSTLAGQGVKFGWAADASVFEHVPEKRATLRYTLKRAFAYGQGPSTICARQTPPNVPKLLFWSVVGAGQAVVYGIFAAGHWLIRSPRRAHWLDRAAQGLGKLLWFGPFELKFYGRAAV